LCFLEEKEKGFEKKRKEKKEKKTCSPKFFLPKSKIFLFSNFCFFPFFLEDTHYRLVKDLTLTPLRMHPHKHTRSWLLD